MSSSASSAASGSSLYDNDGPFLLRLNATMMVVSGVAVCLRFISRRLIKQEYLWDDWLIVMALPFSWAVCICEIVAIYHGGFGRHVQFVAEEDYTNFHMCHYVVQITMIISIALIKFSILQFYRRIFAVHDRTTQMCLFVIALFIAGWLIATELSAVFFCTPIYGFWAPTAAEKCISIVPWNIGVGIPNILTDVVLLAFPLSLIWRLQITRPQKFAVSGVFALGGFIVVVSSLRLASVFQIENIADFTWFLVPVGIWTAVETNIGILCACLPSMRPLLQLLLHGTLASFSNIKTSGTPISSSGNAWRGLGRSHRERENMNFSTLNDSAEVDATPYSRNTVTVFAKGRKGDGKGSICRVEEAESGEEGGRGIQLTHDIQWISSER